MIYFFRIKTIEEFPELDEKSAVLVSFNDTSKAHKFLDMLALANPRYVGFFGANGEKLHDDFDEIVISKNLNALTTWHVDEEIDEVAWEFCTLHYPQNSQSGNAYVIESGSTELIKAVRKIAEQKDIEN